jgi:Raf kinase inhibitor-like YbhB/YbcL family protein
MSYQTYEDPSFALASPAFAHEMPIPFENSCDGGNVSPELIWSTVPVGTQSFALVVYDPDAPDGDFTHWVVYDLPGDLRGLSAGAGNVGGLRGLNGHGALGYTGPCPPPGHGIHRYVFQLRAIDRPSIGLAEGATRDQVEDAAAYYTLSVASMIGTYIRP